VKKKNIYIYIFYLYKDTGHLNKLFVTILKDSMWGASCGTDKCSQFCSVDNTVTVPNI